MKIMVVTRRGGIDFKNFIQIKFADQGGEVGKKEGVVCLSGGGRGGGGVDNPMPTMITITINNSIY